MRILVMLLSAWLICLVSPNTTSGVVRDNIFQIQGVIVEDNRTSEQYIFHPQGRIRRAVPKYPVQPLPIAQQRSHFNNGAQQQLPQSPTLQRPNLQGGARQSFNGGARPGPPGSPHGTLPDGGKQRGLGGSTYYYPERKPFPLPKCFHNPTGYVCCNEDLNDLIVDTYAQLEQRPKFHACNVQLIATHLQINAEKRFNTAFETVAGYEDFAQKVHFRGDLVCKVELGGRYMLAYATQTDKYNNDLNHHKKMRRGLLEPIPNHHLSQKYSLLI